MPAKKFCPVSLLKSTLPYVGAVATIAVMAFTRDLLDPILGDHHPFILISFAVLFTAYYFGTKPAVLAMVLGIFVTTYLFVPPRHQLWIVEREHQTGMIIYLLVCSSAIAMSASERAARRRERLKKEELENEVAAHQRTHEALLRVNKLLEERAAQATAEHELIG